MKNKKRILSVTIKRMVDDCPDTSWLGEYSNQATSEYSIDREHSLECVANNPIDKETRDKLERIAEYINSLRTDSELDTPEDQVLSEAIAAVCDISELTEHCDCNKSGDRLRNEYRYFNPSFNYVDKHGHALPENTPEEVRKYVRQDYERMEEMNHGYWCMIGIQAEAQVSIPSGSSSVTSRVQSFGLWGIESDSGESYLEEIEQEQLSDLRAELKTLGFSSRAISTAFKNIERKDQ